MTYFKPRLYKGVLPREESDESSSQWKANCGLQSLPALEDLHISLEMKDHYLTPK
jgi:hypothetical protein